MHPLRFAMPVAAWLALACPAQAQSAPAADAGPFAWIAPVVQPITDWGAWLWSWVVWEEKAVADEVAIIEADLSAFADAIRRDVKALDKLVESCGFDVAEVEIGLGPLPEVLLELEFRRRLTAGERLEILSRLDEIDDIIAPIERMLVEAMFKASDTVYAMDDAIGFELKALRIEVDLIPHTALVIGPVGEAAATH